MKDKDAQLMMEALRDNDRWDARRGRDDGSGAEHAKAVQWTKDIKAKLAQAREVGDSKEANKLQRYLDMHGIDEDGGAQGIHGPLDRVSVLVIGKISDFPDKLIDDLIYSSIEDVESEMGADPSAKHDLNQLDVNSKVKDLIIHSLHQLVYGTNTQPDVR